MSDRKRRIRLIRWSRHRGDERRAELVPIEAEANAQREANRAASAERLRCEAALRSALEHLCSPELLGSLAQELQFAERFELKVARARATSEAALSVAQERVDLARKDRRALENWANRLSTAEALAASKAEELDLSELARLGRLHRDSVARPSKRRAQVK
ncbi:MAG: hypothetical protein JKY65_31745 [Planctomycetes bacterium]|nr:hypothetical protein [Planctomycetota bacterium]